MTLRTIIAAATVMVACHAAQAQSIQDINNGIAALLAKDPNHGGDPVKWATTCPSPCSLPAKLGDGGQELQFRTAALIFARDNKELQVKGLVSCNSSCTILVDLAASLGVKTCVGWETAWGVHTAFEKTNGKAVATPTQYQYQAPAIAKWIATQGGMKAGFRYHYVPSEIVEQTYGLCPGTAL